MIFTTNNWRPRAPIAAFVVFYWLLGCGGESSHVDDNNLRNDVIDCEAAAAQLLNCCPSTVQVPSCEYSKTVYTCGWPIEHEFYETTTDMPLDDSTSQTIMGASCDAIIANDDCTRTWPDHHVTADQAAQALQNNEEGYVEDHPDGICGEWGEF